MDKGLEEVELEHMSCSEEQDMLIRRIHQCGGFVYHNVGCARGQGSVLRILSEHPRMTQKELLALLNVQPGSLSEILTKLERKGLIDRAKDERDKRKVQVSLTEKGRQDIEEYAGGPEIQDLFCGLEPEERKELYRLLTKLTDDWETRYGKSRSARRGDKEKHHSHGYDKRPEGREDHSKGADVQ